MTIKRFHVCSKPGCPELTPCPKHARPKSWSPERDREKQAMFRQMVMFRAGGVCERCHHALATQAHHVRPGYEPEHGQALCDDCHRAVDSNARRTA